MVTVLNDYFQPPIKVPPQELHSSTDSQEIKTKCSQIDKFWIAWRYLRAPTLYECCVIVDITGHDYVVPNLLFFSDRCNGRIRFFPDGARRQQYNNVCGMLKKSYNPITYTQNNLWLNLSGVSKLEREMLQHGRLHQMAITTHLTVNSILQICCFQCNGDETNINLRTKYVLWILTGCGLKIKLRWVIRLLVIHGWGDFWV